MKLLKFAYTFLYIIQRETDKIIIIINILFIEVAYTFFVHNPKINRQILRINVEQI